MIRSKCSNGIRYNSRPVNRECSLTAYIKLVGLANFDTDSDRLNDSDFEYA